MKVPLFQNCCFLRIAIFSSDAVFPHRNVYCQSGLPQIPLSSTILSIPQVFDLKSVLVQGEPHCIMLGISCRGVGPICL